MRVLAHVALASALAGCGAAEQSNAETIPSAVLDSDDTKEDTGATFRHCRAVHRDDVTDEVTCAGYSIEIRKREETSFEPILEAYIQANVYDKTSKSGEYETQISMYQLLVRKDKWPGRSFRLEPKVTGASAQLGFIVVGEGADGQTLSISCSGKEVADRDANLESDCKAAMVYIMTLGLPKELFEARE